MKIFLLLIVMRGPFITEAIEDSLLRQYRGNTLRKSFSEVQGDFLNMKINSDDTQELQNEEQIVINPANPSNIVAVWRDFRLGYRRVAYGVSIDGGETWIDMLFDGTPYYRDSDPGLTVSADGIFYAVVLNFIALWDTSAIYVYRSTTGGISWEGPYLAVGPSYSDFEDKELIACDRTQSPYSGNLYITWTRFSPSYDTDIYITRSEDSALSWSPPLKVSDTSGTQWSVPVIGVNGEVHIFWLDYNYSAIMQDISYDGGVNFGGDSIVVNVSYPERYLNGDIWAFSYPAATVDIFPSSPYYGNIYIAYMDENLFGETDIFLIKSTDGGMSWSLPQRVNDDSIGNGRDQFHPWIAVDSTGTVSVIFYDRRLDPSNWLFDLYYTKSTDGGESFEPNIRVTTVSSDPSDATILAGLIGEYIGLDSWNGIPFPLWTDTREGNQDVYFGLWQGVDIKERNGEKEFLPVRVPSIFMDNLSIGIPVDSYYRLSLFDLSGREILSVDKLLDRGRYTLYLGELPAGLYILKVDMRSSFRTFKTIKF